MIAVYNLQRNPRLSAYYPVSPDQWSVQGDALGGSEKTQNTLPAPAPSH